MYTFSFPNTHHDIITSEGDGMVYNIENITFT